MKKFNLFFSLLALCCLTTTVQGQYLEAEFDVAVETDVLYGANASILPIIAQVADEALRLPLFMDVYTPVGDDDNGPRPVMIVMHTGNFLPFPDNNGTGGTKRDSTVVEACTRLAARGYVACAVDYRLGWNPIDPSEDIRKFFLINAAYRGIQDVRTAVRYMRLLERDAMNPYNINPDQVGVWGIGTGGYIAAGVNTVDDYNEIVIPKFLIDLGVGPQPMVIEGINGDINGTSVGVLPVALPPLPAGDTLCYPNHVTYADGEEISSEIGFTVNMGGALGDTSWIDENTGPWVSFHVPSDPFAPYETGTLTVPGTGDPLDPSDDFAVVEVSGSYDIQQVANSFGVNDIFGDNVPSDIVDFSEVADARNDGAEGLFPFPNDLEFNNSAPWDFYAEDNPGAMVFGPPNPTVARTYWDTIFSYVGPRACIALGLGCEFLGDEVITANEVGMTVAPNPAFDRVFIETEAEHPMQSVELYDITGKLMHGTEIIDNHQVWIERRNLPPGMYMARVQFEEGIVIRQIVFQ